MNFHYQYSLQRPAALYYLATQKNLFGSDYLISDRASKNYNWKNHWRAPGPLLVLNAGKQVCRIYNSIVVIAFYTDEIIPANGPESFGGLTGNGSSELQYLKCILPGMRPNSELVNQPPRKTITPPNDGKKYTVPQFTKEIQQLINQREWLKNNQFPGPDLNMITQPYCDH